MERIYLNKLDINYFRKCIEEIITNYTNEEYCNEDIIKGLKTLYMHIAGLRDSFYIFSIDDIYELQAPILDALIKLDETLVLHTTFENEQIRYLKI
jgi:hypothetical protein